MRKWKTSISCLMILVLALSLLGTGAFAANENSSVFGLDNYIVSSAADASTSDNYTSCNFGTDEANGRVWTDKSVTGGTDGVFTVTLSAMAQEYKYDIKDVVRPSDYKTVDALFILDFSGSMDDDSDYNLSDGSPRIAAAVNATNAAITTIMDCNPNNRVMVCAYRDSSTVYTILSLGSYTSTTNFTTSDGTYQQFLTFGTGRGCNSSTTDYSTVKVDKGVSRTDGGSVSTSSSYSVSGGTGTQYGIYSACSSFVTQAQNQSSTDDRIRFPFVMLLTDGDSNYAANEQYWDGTISSSNADYYGDGSTSSAKITALTILTAAYQKNQIASAYTNLNAAKGYNTPVSTEWFNIGVGESDPSSVSTSKYTLLQAQVDPSLITTGTSTDVKNLKSYIAQYTSTDARKAYNLENGGYNYCTQYHYFTKTSTGLASAFEDFGDAIADCSTSMIPPITSDSSVSDDSTAHITFTDVIGDGMTIDGSSLSLTLNGTKYTTNAGTDGTYTFTSGSTTLKSTATISGNTVIWTLYGEELPTVEFANRYKPGEEDDSGKIYSTVPSPACLSYSVKPASDATATAEEHGNVLYTNSTATAAFIPAEKNTYYDTLESTISKDSNTAVTSDPVQSSTTDNNTVVNTLGNNGVINQLYKITISANKDSVAVGDTIEYTVTVTNLTRTTLSSGADISVTLPTGVSLTNGQTTWGKQTINASTPWQQKITAKVETASATTLDAEATLTVGTAKATDVVSTYTTETKTYQATVNTMLNGSLKSYTDIATSTSSLSLVKDNVVYKLTADQAGSTFTSENILLPGTYTIQNEAGTALGTVEIADQNKSVDVNWYTVHFVVSDNVSKLLTIADQTVLGGQTATKPTDSVKGYTLKGWYTSKTYTEDFSYTTPITKETTVYGNWDNNPVNLTFDKFQEGTVGTDDAAAIPSGTAVKTTISIPYGSTIKIDSKKGSSSYTPVGGENDTKTTITATNEAGYIVNEATPTATGLVFVGWTISENGGTYTLTAQYAEDTVGQTEDYKDKTPGSDGIPDVFQKKITGQIVGGYWTSGSGQDNEDRVVYLNLTDKDGNLSPDGTAVLELPKTMVPAADYSKPGYWFDGSGKEVTLTGDNKNSITINKDSSDKLIYQYSPVGTFTKAQTDGNGNPIGEPEKNAELKVSLGKTLYIDPNNGTYTDSNSTKHTQLYAITNVTKPSELKVNDPTPPEGMTFFGWEKTEDKDGNVTLKAIYEKDTLGKTDDNGKDKGDGVPDKYQAKVTYTADGGTWDINSKTTLVEYVTLTDSQGNWSSEGSGKLASVPSAATANASHEGDGAWDGTTPVKNVTTVTKDTEYTYKFADKTYSVQITTKLNGTTTPTSSITGESTLYLGDARTALTGSNGVYTQTVTAGTYVIYKSSSAEDTTSYGSLTIASGADSADPVELNWYSVSFNIGDHGSDAPKTQNIFGGNMAVEPETEPSDDDYEFQGWYLDLAGDEFDFNTPITQKTELKALWTKKDISVTYDKFQGTGDVPESAPVSTTTWVVNNQQVKIVFDTNKGVSYKLNGTVPGELNQTFNATNAGGYTLSEVNVKDGYVFVGWKQTREGDTLVLTAMFEDDVIDNDGGDPGDDIPDRFEKTVTYTIENGVWDDETSDPISEIVVLTKDGKWSENGSAVLTVPTGMTADTGYDNGAWKPTLPVDNIAKYTDFNTEGKLAFTYSYTIKQFTVKDDDDEKTSVDYGKKILLDPNKGSYKGSTDICTLVESVEKDYTISELIDSALIDQEGGLLRSGYDFSHFTVGKDVDENVVITAHWAPNGDYVEYNPDAIDDPQPGELTVEPGKTLTINPNGGKYKDKEDPTIIEDITEDTEIGHIDDPEPPTDYLFVGWKQSSDESGNVTLTAQYELDEVGKKDGDGNDKGDGIPDRFEKKVTYLVENGYWDTAKTDSASRVQYVELKNDGHWAEDGSGTISAPNVATATPDDGHTADGAWNSSFPANNTVSGNEPITFTYSFGTWKTYAVCYNVNGGDASSKPADQTKTYGTDLTLTGKPSREGYTFTGWNTYADGSGTGYSEGGSYSANEAVTLYAQWQVNKHDITYKDKDGNEKTVEDVEYGKAVTVDPNGGTLTKGGKDYTHESPYMFKMPDNAVALADELGTEPVRSGYTFIGWSETQDTEGNVTFIAQWAQDKTVTYDEHQEDTEPKENTAVVPANKTLIIDPNGGFWNSKDTPSEFPYNALSFEEVGPATPPAGKVFDGWTKSTDNGNTTLTANYADDDNGDGIADKYQKQVTFSIIGGTWDGSDANDKVVVVNLTDAEGKLSTKGTATVTFPEGMQVSEGYITKGAKWIPSEPANNIVSGNDSVTYTYRFLMEGQHLIDFNEYEGDDEQPQEKVVEVFEHHSLTIDPNGGKYNGKSDITVYENVTKDISVDDPKAPDDYEFTGWQETLDEEGNVTLTAMYKEIPEEAEPAPKPPHTGDSALPGLWLTLMAIGGMGLTALKLRKKEN